MTQLENGWIETDGQLVKVHLANQFFYAVLILFMLVASGAGIMS
ncbi:hypothetical protein [Cohnella mopanensis]|nr:hypothetical protein [Cohnella mopanensis]